MEDEAGKLSKNKQAKFERQLEQVNMQLKQLQNNKRTEKTKNRLKKLRQKKLYLEQNLGLKEPARYKTWTRWSKAPDKVRFYRGK